MRRDDYGSAGSLLKGNIVRHESQPQSPTWSGRRGHPIGFALFIETASRDCDLIETDSRNYQVDRFAVRRLQSL
jgi:hypothetical protein